MNVKVGQMERVGMEMKGGSAKDRGGMSKDSTVTHSLRPQKKLIQRQILYTKSTYMHNNESTAVVE